MDGAAIWFLDQIALGKRRWPSGCRGKGIVPGKRPRPRPPRSGSPVRNPDPKALEAAAQRAIYLGSPKHKFGAFFGQVGRPRANPTTVEQARQDPPTPPFTMICDEKWNRRDPAAEATELLRSAIRRGQIAHPLGVDGLPGYVWARDPEDASVVYEAKRLSVPSNGYKAYPLVDAQISLIGIIIR